MAERPSLFRRIGTWGDRRLLQGLPEWDLFPSDEMRIAAVEQLDKELESSNRFWLTVVLVVLIVIGLTLMVIELLQRVAPTMPGWSATVIKIAGLAVGYVLVVAVWRGGVVRRLRRKLIDVGVPVCRRCGYGLRGIDAPRCPECGWSVDDRLRALMRSTKTRGADSRRPAGDDEAARP